MRAFLAAVGYLEALLLSSVSEYHGGMSDNDKKISDEAVEAAAKALWEHGEMPEFGWDQLDRVSKIVSLDEARSALDAAAPYMLRDADKEVQRLRAELELVYSTHPSNPYRSQA